MEPNTYVQYRRRTLTVEGIIDKLKTEGLNFSNEEEAKNILQRTTYHRFKFYLHPFLVSLDPKDKPKKFKEGVDFNNALNLYLFNKDLSHLLLKYIAEIEVYLRKSLNQFFIKQNHGYFWYLNDGIIFTPTVAQLAAFKEKDPSYQTPLSRIQSIRKKLKGQFLKSKEKHNEHYRNKYKNPEHEVFEYMPPFWHISEFMTLGQISDFIEHIDKSIFIQRGRKNSLDDLAKEFGAPKFQYFITWVNGLREIRNRCAHHNRVFNANYAAVNLRDIKLQFLSPKPNRLYSILIALDSMYFNINQVHINKDIEHLIDKYSVDAHLYSCGFPNEWKNDSYWTGNLTLVSNTA